MKSYRPNVNAQKERYARRIAFHRLCTTAGPERPNTIKNNSTPWGERAPQSLAEAIALVEQIEKMNRPWKT